MAYGKDFTKVKGKRKSTRSTKKTKKVSKKEYFRPGKFLRAGLYVQKEAFVSLPFTHSFNAAIPANNKIYTASYNGHGICCPITNSGLLPQPGEKYPMGTVKYGQFYQRCRVLGAKITVTINTTAPGSDPELPFMAALMVGQGLKNDTDPDSTWYKMANADADDTITYPGTKYRLLGNQSGNSSSVVMSRYVSAKDIIGVKDMRDIHYGCELPGNRAMFPAGSNYDIPEHSWFIMLKLARNVADEKAIDVNCITRIKYYCHLYGRVYDSQGVVPE